MMGQMGQAGLSGDNTIGSERLRSTRTAGVTLTLSPCTTAQTVNDWKSGEVARPRDAQGSAPTRLGRSRPSHALSQQETRR